MKKWILCCLALLDLRAFDLHSSIDLVLEKSHKLKEQKMKLYKLQSELGIYSSNYYPKIDLSYSGNYGAISSNFDNKINLGLGINLFNGLKDQNSIAMQEKNIQSQKEEIRREQEEVKYMTKKLYVQILLTKGSLDISKESAHLLELQLKQAEQFYKQGISAKNSVLSVEVSLASARLEINSYLTRLNYLISAMEEMMESKIELSEMEDLPLYEEEIDYDRLSALIFDYRPEYRALQRKKEALGYEIASLKGEYYPKVDFGISGEYRPNAKNDPASQVSIGLSMRLNLFNGLKNLYSIEAKQYELLALESKILAYKKDALTELKKAVGDFNLAKDQYILSTKTIESAQENYRIVSNRYKQKLETSSDLLDAEIKLRNARANLLKSKYGIWESLFYVEYLMGGNKNYFFKYHKK